MKVSKVSKIDFELSMIERRMSFLNDLIVSKVSSSLRRFLDIPFCGVGAGKVQDRGGSEFIRIAKKSFPYKFGIKLSDSEFIAISFPMEFVSICSDLWIGGKGDAYSLDKNEGGDLGIAKPSIVERAFVSSFFGLDSDGGFSADLGFVPSVISDAFKDSLGEDIEVQFICDSELSINQTTRVYSIETELEHGDSVVNLSIVATSKALEVLDEKSKSLKIDLSDVDMELELQYEGFLIPYADLASIDVGSSISIPACDSVSLVNPCDKSKIATGELGAFGGESPKGMFKIKKI